MAHMTVSQILVSSAEVRADLELLAGSGRLAPLRDVRQFYFLQNTLRSLDKSAVYVF